MDWSQIGVLIIAGTIGAWIGMMISRYLKRKRSSQEDATGSSKVNE